MSKAKELLKGRQLCFCNALGQSAREDRGGFKRIVELAAEFDGTHVHVGEIPFRYGNGVLPDNRDPYAAWRGPQCELGRIATRPCFAPNIDDEEALSLYRRAMRAYATLFPEVDHYRFMSNDSGGAVSPGGRTSTPASTGRFTSACTRPPRSGTSSRRRSGTLSERGQP